MSTMPSDQHFIARYEPLWRELAALCEKARSYGVRSLSPEELTRLERLYRLATVHLAQVASRTRNKALADTLNKLVARAHSLLYVAPHRSPLATAARFYAKAFPQTVAKHWKCHALSLLLLVSGAIAGAVMMHRDLPAAYGLMFDDVRLPGCSAEQLESFLETDDSMQSPEKLIFLSFLFSHNTKVGLLAFASGILAGVPTVFLMLLNGGMLGSFTAMHHGKGLGSEVWAWLLPHGITELSAVVLCGGAGFMLGAAVVRPGAFGRKDALVAAGREAFHVLLGIVPMFLFAGFAESFVRESSLSMWQRYAIAAITAVFWMAYFTWGAVSQLRAAREAQDATAGSAP